MVTLNNSTRKKEEYEVQKDDSDKTLRTIDFKIHPQINSPTLINKPDKILTPSIVLT